jgi:hypothetical protein
MQVSKADGVQYGGHGTDWYSPKDIRITGKCKYVPQGEGYFEQTGK